MSARIPNWSRIAFFVLLPFALYVLWDYVETRRIASRLDAIERRKEPLVIQGPTPTGQAREAERLYRAAAALVVSPGELPVIERNQLPAGANDDRWTPQTLALVRAYVDANREALELVDRAAGLPFIGFLPGTSYNYLVSDLVTLRRVLERRAALATHDGKGDAALSSFYSEARLAKAIDSTRNSERLLITPIPLFSGLSAAVAAAPPGSRVREALAGAFADLDREDRLRTSLLVSRASMFTMASLGPRRHAANPLLAHMMVSQFDTYDQLLTAAEKPWPQRIEAVNAVDKWPDLILFRSSGRVLREFTKTVVDQVRRIRCARLIVSTTPIDLVDPLTGTRLEMLNCHL
jgi:hypothetical protein